jgi:formamidopyrimidine-DNA glycosylase
MPELPEVETVRRGLEPFLAGARIAEVELNRGDLRFPFPERFAERLSGARIEALTRRGKYMIAPLSTGESLILHLGMTGRFSIAEAQRQPGAFYYAAPPDAAHDHVRLAVRRDRKTSVVIYNDPRRFGFMDLVPSADVEASSHFRAMGPEPLSAAFTAAALRAALKGKAAPAKAALLDQRVVAGLGNIYVCEALFRAGVSPMRKAGSISAARVDRLHGAVIAVLHEAIAAGGSTLRDFAAADGAAGGFQERFLVYDRESEACPNCRGAIVRTVQSGRSTFYCARCQR